LLLFVPIASRWKGTLVLAAFLTTLAHELSAWLVRFVHPAFAWLKVGAFLAMELCLFLLIVLLFVYTARPSRNAYKETD